MAILHKFIAVIIGSLLMAVGINVFLVNHQLLDGGTFGMGLILHYLTGAPVGLVVILLSIPVFFLAWFYHRPFFYNSLHGMLFSSFMIDLTYHPLRGFGIYLDQNPFVSAILGGLFVGSGIGIMLHFDASIGGTDLLCQMLANYAKLNPGIVIFIIDFIIVCIGSIFVEEGSILLSCITVICVGTMTSLLSVKRKNEKVYAY
ncbi:YitT family protein [Paenisporosarcina indica]|uniref:YitT family protein n=1 Tax=Paenisporosarcina indica TaxID=650093 RepID=UPI000AA4E078|nr:YitT family protein [Paenisporosarcina indica]